MIISLARLAGQCRTVEEQEVIVIRSVVMTVDVVREALVVIVLLVVLLENEGVLVDVAVPMLVDVADTGHTVVYSVMISVVTCPTGQLVTVGAQEVTV